MARLPGVVRQNMADFHSNPLDWDTVQLSLAVCSKNPMKATHNMALQPELSVPRRRCVPACVFQRRSRPRLSSGVWRNKRRVFAVCPPTPGPIFFSSILFMCFYYWGHPLLRWQGDVGLPSTGWECHVKQTPHEYLYPNLWNRKCL